MGWSVTIRDPSLNACGAPVNWRVRARFQQRARGLTTSMVNDWVRQVEVLPREVRFGKFVHRAECRWDAPEIDICGQLARPGIERGLEVVAVRVFPELPI